MITANNTHVFDSWEDVLVGRKLDLEVPGPELTRVGQIVVGNQGHLYIPRGPGANTILKLDRNGRLLNEIPVVSDTGSFSIFALDTTQDNLFVFDPFTRTVTVVRSPDGRVLRRFRISSWPAAMTVLRDGTLVTYSAAGETGRHFRDLFRTRPVGGGRVFERFDQDGRRLAVAYRIQDDLLRIFHGRVHTGGIVQVADGGLIGIHPAEFQLVRLTSDLDVIELLRAPENDPWAPHPPQFPPDLDPYDYRPPHQEWWDSFMHIGRPFALTPDLLLLTVWVSRGMAATEYYANVYTVNGSVLAEGLRVPHDGRIVGAGGGAVYVVRNASMRDDGAEEPLEIYEYTLRSDVLRSWNSQS